MSAGGEVVASGRRSNCLRWFFNLWCGALLPYGAGRSFLSRSRETVVSRETESHVIPRAFAKPNAAFLAS